MPNYTINWVSGIEDDFISEDEFLKVEKRMQRVATNPYAFSKLIGGTDNQIRRVRIDDFRLFIYIREETQEIYCLAYLPRKSCYSKKSLNKVLTIVKKAF